MGGISESIMQIIKSRLFDQFPEIIFGLSTKNGLENSTRFHFNLSLTVGDDPAVVLKNRESFFNELGLTTDNVAIQKQIHSDQITIVEKPGVIGESDAMITQKPGIGLAVSTADCVPCFIYDKKNKLISGIHSGWRGTQNKILLKTVNKLKEQFNSDPADLWVYVGPSISQKNYEVGEEVASQFDENYCLRLNGKIYLDVLKANIDMLVQAGIPDDHIEVSPLCSYEENDLLHSYRREGQLSGRALGLIAMKGI